MTLTNPVPRWLNPDVHPSADLIERVTAAADAFEVLADLVTGFADTHRKSIEDFHDWFDATFVAEDGGVVWETVHKITGYDRLGWRLQDAGSYLCGLADDVLRDSDKYGLTERGVHKAVARGDLDAAHLARFTGGAA